MCDRRIGKRAGADDPAAATTVAKPHPRMSTYLTLFTGLALFNVFLSLLIIICAWIAPDVSTNIQVSIVYTFLGFIVLSGAGLQFLYRTQLVNTICGSCPLTAIEL